MDNLISLLTAMKEEIDGLMARLDIAGRARRIDEIDQQASAANFWSDQESAQKIMRERSRLEKDVKRWQAVAMRINDALELAELGDETLLDDLAIEVEALTPLVERMSLHALLSGPYDDENAVLAIHAGAGGVDSQNWALMLERMYLRWAERSGYAVEVLDRNDESEDGIKSVTMSIQGDFAYGYLQSEQGVHRLVRLSPYDSAHRRHTSFAKVELWPDIQGDIDIDINENDLRIDTYRASGVRSLHGQTRAD